MKKSLSSSLEADNGTRKAVQSTALATKRFRLIAFILALGFGKNLWRCQAKGRAPPYSNQADGESSARVGYGNRNRPRSGRY